MLQRLYRRVGPYFKKVILSYGIVVGLPVLALCMLVYQTGVNHVTQEIYAGQQALCAQIAQYVAQRLDDGKLLITRMEADEDIRSFFADPEGAVLRLQDYLQCSTLFSDLLLYDQQGVYYSARDRGPADMAARFPFSPREQAYLNAYTTDKKPRLAYFPQANAIMYIAPCTDLKVTLIGVFSQNAVENLCDVSSSSAMRYGAVMLVDTQQQRAFVQDWGGILTENEENISFTESINGYGWQMMLMIPASYVNARTQIVNLALWVMLILVMSFLMIVTVSSYHYRPIRDLSALTGQSPEYDDFASNELVSISAALKAGRQLTNEAMHQKNILRENLILRLINGICVQEEEIRATLGSLDMLTGASGCMVIVMRYPHPEENISHEALMNYIDVRYSRKDMAYAVETETDDMRLVVTLLKLPAVTRDATPERVIADLQLFIRHRMNTLFFFGMGTPHHLERISTSYMEAVTAVFHCNENNHMVHYENLLSSRLLEFQYNPEFQKKLQLLRHSLRAANETVVWQLLDELEHEYQSSPTWRYSAFRLTEAILQMVMDKENDRYRQADSFPELSRKLNLALATNVLDEHRALMRVILQQMLEIGKGYNARRETAVRDQLTQWMQAHICDPSLSLTMLTEAFGFSVPYWSRLFTEQLGIGFNDWVWQSRLSIAKEKLLHTDLPIRQIVQEIGYTDVSSFSRRFKTEEGIPPSQFRTAVCTTPDIPKLSTNGDGRRIM